MLMTWPKRLHGRILAALAAMVLAGVATDAAAVQGDTSNINPELAQSLNQGTISLGDLQIVNPGGNIQSAPAASDDSSPPAVPITHTVAPGENLFRIALRYGVPMRELARENNIANPNQLHVGQPLVIPGAPVSFSYDDQSQHIQYDFPTPGVYSLIQAQSNVLVSTVTVPRAGEVVFHDPDTIVIDTSPPVSVLLPDQQAWDTVAPYFIDTTSFFTPDGIQIFGMTSGDPSQTVKQLVAAGFDAEVGDCIEMKGDLIAAMVPTAQAAQQPSTGTVRVVNLDGQALQNVQVLRTHDLRLPANVVEPSSVAAGSTGHEFKVSFVATDLIENDQLRFTTPTGFSQPESAAGKPGYTTVTSEGSIGQPVISKDTVTVPVQRLRPGESVTFVYGSGGGDAGVAAPRTAGRAPVIFETKTIYDDSVSILVTAAAAPARQASGSIGNGRPVNIGFGPQGTTVGTDQFQVTVPRQGPLAVKKQGNPPGGAATPGGSKQPFGRSTADQPLNGPPDIRTTDAQGRVPVQGGTEAGDKLSVADGTCNTATAPIGPGGG